MRAPTTSRGILALVAGIAIFSVQDLILKTLSGDYPLHQAMVLRSLTALPFHVLIVWWFDGRLGTITTPGWWKMLLRGALNFAAYTAYYLGLATLPMANTVALFFTAPLFITLSAALILGERVAASSAVAVGLGFAGVLLIVKPGSSGFELAALLPILGALGYAVSMIVARPMGRTETAAAMAFWGNICFLIFALALSAVFGSGALAETSHPALAFLTRGWIVPTPRDLALMASCGVIAAVGLTLLTQAYRIAPSSAVAPFEYSFMFWGVLWGWLVWGDNPDAWAWAGIAVIVGAGLYLIRQPSTAAPERTAARDAAS
ncbi:DMT family transporter [Rhodobacter sp. Har01]|uniref:DMT family transporter n=1 Tax=Rhodobacter sp. Har01 TaxID=2883999 RepID=UPI001D06CC79|nr:DMT family transporter [Rhodobacter sp. Har01]MCB6176963.1 DMT family transporter [Rhodobacter sp. Har01]